MKLSTILAEFSSHYGICDTMFALDINNEKMFNSLAKIKKTPSRSNILSSSLNASQYSIESRKKWSKVDPNLQMSLTNPMHHWDYSSWPEEQHSPQDSLTKYGYETKVSVETPCMLNTNWIGRFYLVTKNIDQLENPRFIKKIDSDLRDIHYMIMTKEMNYLNPFSDYRVIKERDKKILAMISQGRSREHIANECYLTPRGVDYCVQQLKKKLGASNYANLIKIASQNYLIE
ncbi:helix-turn-helix transcriptional regulator [Shewanella intestini]|uniref:HTH luxR-type domain-containing protein n=1 Tax=Shewanella intestini TaxID=2017544 RepID=A0ABS5I229_9GAMM|nr:MULTISPECIES: LuxR C-terminal-related transcriptional regulator [Shewanella]MBR9727941.1 hypothetical protein [Shewanella intestini]MRG36508.1 hypothetical protein [Shewanella sp. XMDDZSB0408]